ncbi:MAG TPA: acetylornithine/succinylornithine family transaminase [Minicystis sp.]|nr:acetylornithine/succinylornithine family transaminase [Minicystis sp.]
MTSPAAPSAQAPASPANASGDTRALLALGERRLLGNYRQAPFVLERGEGCRVFDTDGRSYLDLCAGVAVDALGHAHPRLAAAIAEQAARLMHVSNYFYNAENVRLADELCRKLRFDRAFFCNSGAEANEAMLKLARRFHYVAGQRDRYRVVAFHQSFHGRTLGAIALTGNPKYREGFGPPLAGVTHVAYGDAAAVRAAMGPDVAAILVEPVQGEGGVNVPPKGFLPELRAIANEHGALLLVDEVQTGMGRTGTWLGCDHEGVEADAIALAKGLGGGFPIGALLLRERLNAALPPGTHGATFGGNPLASRAARTVLAVLEEERLVEGAAEKGEHLAKELAKLVARHPKILVGHRGLGLLQAAVLAPGLEARAALVKMREHGVLLTAAGTDALRFSPPLVVTTAELDEGVARVDAALGELVTAR